MRLTDVYKEPQSRPSIKTVELEAKKNLNEVQEEVDKFRKIK